MLFIAVCGAQMTLVLGSRRLAITYRVTAATASAIFALAALASILWARLADRIEPPIVYVVFFAIEALAAFLPIEHGGLSMVILVQLCYCGALTVMPSFAVNVLFSNSRSAVLMKKPFTAVLLLSLILSAQPPAHPPRIKLVLLIAIDQFRYDYLTRFRSQYTGGLNRLLVNGADFLNANLDHYPTVTAVGHSTMLSGATPSVSGIVGNDWYDRDSGKAVTSVSDDTVRRLDSGGEGSSPRRLLVSTVGDEMKMADPAARVIGMSLKDRAAILPCGHMADAAYWYDTHTGAFVSSTYYFPALPSWVETFNHRHPVDKYSGATWQFLSDPASKGIKMPDSGAALNSAIYASPFGNELLETFAEDAIREEKLGQRHATDLLTISFSSIDAVGHADGPDSPEVHDMAVRIDRTIGKLFADLDRTVGMDRVLVILTSDHGVAPLPEKLVQEKMPGGRMHGGDIFKTMQTALEQRFGSGKWILYTAGAQPYFNEDLIKSKKLRDSEVQDVAAKSIARSPHVARVYTRYELERGQVSGDHFTEMVVRSFNARRSGDLDFLLDPYWIRGSGGATHGTPYTYDTHIPLLFMGPRIRPGRYARNVVLNDLAPTLSTILNIQTPGGSVGHVLTDLLP